MVPEVFYSVCYNSKSVPPEISSLHTFSPAILHGYSRHRVRDCDYPGIVADKDPAIQKSTVFGTLVTGLTRANMDKLDYFEGGQYERRRVRVNVLEKVGDVNGKGNVEGEEKDADVYVFLNEDELEDKEWDLEEFRKEKLSKWTRAGYVFEGELDYFCLEYLPLICFPSLEEVSFVIDLRCALSRL